MVSWKRSKTYTMLAAVQFLIALFFAYAVFIVPSIELQFATGGLAVVFASIAASDIRDMADKHKTDQILDKLIKIEDLQKEIQSEQKEQKEQESSRQPIIASLQAFTQYYMDYIANQKESENEKS